MIHLHSHGGKYNEKQTTQLNLIWKNKNTNNGAVPKLKNCKLSNHTFQVIFRFKPDAIANECIILDFLELNGFKIIILLEISKSYVILSNIGPTN